MPQRAQIDWFGRSFSSRMMIMMAAFLFSFGIASLFGSLACHHTMLAIAI